MKKISALLLIMVMIFSLCACSANSKDGAIDTIVSSTDTEGTPADADNTGSSDKGNAENQEQDTVQGIWEVGYYVDDFNQPTDEWYIINNTNFIGTFSNSATTNSLLNADVLVDRDKNVAFFLYEYGRNTVKNSSERYDDEYDIIMRTADGKDLNMTGYIYCGSDRIVIEDKYSDQVIKALQGDGNVSFRIVKSDRTIESYLLTVITSNFAEVYKNKVG